MLYTLKSENTYFSAATCHVSHWLEFLVSIFITSSDSQWMESDSWLYRDNSCSRELRDQNGGVLQ